MSTALREALEWYARASMHDLELDGGERAQAALAAHQPKPEPTREAILEEAASVADRRAAVLRKMRGFRTEAVELETLAAAIRSLA